MAVKVLARELSGFREALFVSFPFLILSVTLDFFAGSFLGSSFENIMRNYPLILIILPGLMGLRGNIFGAMANRFSTMLYLGEMEPRILRNAAINKNVFLSLLLSILPVLLLWIIGTFKILNLHSAFIIFLIVMSSTILTTLILAYSTALFTIIPFRRGIDPNSVAPPVITSIADLVTIPLLIAFISLYEFEVLPFFLITFLTFAIFLGMSFIIKLKKTEIKVLREMIAILTALAIISAISGGILESYSNLIHLSAILSIMYPAILDCSGNYGSIIGAKTSTMVHLGEIAKPFEKRMLRELLIYGLTGIPIAFIMNFIGILITKAVIGKVIGLLPIFLMSYPIFLSFVMITAHLIALVSERMGFDPDNVTVPVITTVADMFGTIYTVLVAFALA